MQGTGRQLGCFWRPGGFFFFFLSGAPSSTFIFALLQAECACQSQTQTGSFISQVKTGTILATEDNPKSQHVACAARRPSTPSLQPTPSRLGEGRGQPPSSSRLESEAAAPSLARAAQLLLRGRRPRPLSWLRERGGRGRDLLFFPRSPKDRTPDFFFFFSAFSSACSGIFGGGGYSNQEKETCHSVSAFPG